MSELDDGSIKEELDQIMDKVKRAVRNLDEDARDNSEEEEPQQD